MPWSGSSLRRTPEGCAAHARTPERQYDPVKRILEARRLIAPRGSSALTRNCDLLQDCSQHCVTNGLYEMVAEACRRRPLAVRILSPAR